MDQIEARDRVIAAALRLAGSRLSAELNPDDPHRADQVDLDSDLLDEALGAYAAVVARDNPPA
jgi:hypothetical protein